MGKGRLELKINRVHGLAPLVRTVAGGMALSLATLVTAAGPGWVNNFEQAVQIARQQGKPIFVDFSTSWCGVCKQMDRSTLADPVIIQRLDNFVKVKVDGDARQDLMNSFSIEAYPTFLHLDPSGSRVLERREGFMRVQDMASALDRTFQSVGGAAAIAQANNAQQGQQQIQAVNSGRGNGSSQVASTGLQLLTAEQPAAERETRAAAQARTQQEPAAAAPAYNKNDPRLADSVYAMGASPSSERRSRFGSTSSETGLRELAEATANPGAIEQSDDKPEESDQVLTVSKASDKDAETKNTESDEKATAKADEDKKAAQAEEDKKQIAAAKAKAEADRETLTKKPSTEIVSVSASPVIKSRLTNITEEELPKPLLSRTASGVTQTMTPAATNPASAPADPLATIRRIQGNGANTAEPGAAAPKISAKTQEISPAKIIEKTETAKSADSSKPVETGKKETGREVVSASESKSISTSVKSKDEDEAKTSKSNPDKEAKAKSDETAKTSEGASKTDIERWMKDADSKLVSDKKKEARAMYSKVVDKDPKNQFGKSDMAYVKMVSLIVDKDSDLLRRQAYNKIKEFEARYPESDHKDYYTLIRATLALDLGETNEAHRLLGTYPERFPESKYRKMAHETWKELPPVKKESSSKSSKNSADSSRKRTSSDG